MNKLTYRRIQTFSALLTLSVLFATFYFQYVVGLIPCPLCMMQRFCLFLLLAVLSIGIGTLKKAHVLSVVQIAIAAAGLFFSLRQLWLQSLPAEQVPVCMPGLDILIRYFPWQTVMRSLFWGSGDCAEVDWTFVGISMPGWSALYFLLMVFLGVFLFWRTRMPRT